MSVYKARICWKNSGPDFCQNQYSRAHQWHFRGGRLVDATAAPDIVPPPWSEPANVDPEQAFVAALSSCHMLFFLHFASRKGFLVQSYEDDAEGVLEKNDEGKMAFSHVTLRPLIAFAGDRIPDDTEMEALHESAHRHCFIANSVKTRIRIEPSLSTVAAAT